MSEEPGKYHVDKNNLQQYERNKAVSSQYFNRVAAFSEAAIIGGSTDVDEIVNFAIELTDKLIER